MQPAQLNVSPHAGAVDFSALDHAGCDVSVLDPVSVADLLRNAFVYPPHSIYPDVKVVGNGFDPGQDMRGKPQFHFAYQSPVASLRPPAGVVNEPALLKTYHRLLCDAVSRTTRGMHSPWLLHSGGKDSTSMAIAVAEVRPQTTSLTYRGGPEENELASASAVARQLGLRHETLICAAGRAYDRYLAIVPRMPLLTADFALLSYADLATEIGMRGGDGIIDGLGSDSYFGTPVHGRQRVLAMLARRLWLPQGLFTSPLVRRSFKLCYALATLQMASFERRFPGSRFSDAEVDALFGRPIAARSRQRLQPYRSDIAAAPSAEAVSRIAMALIEESAFAKGLYATRALRLRLAFPYCDARLRDWIFHDVPDELLIGPGGVNKVLVRKHIALHFQKLPYVEAKGCFRFDVCGLARERFDQVHAFAAQGSDQLPGAVRWLERHRHQWDNKYFASKFYLLAITLPWLLSRRLGPLPAATEEFSS